MKNIYLASLFCTGMAIMGIEMTAVRLIAPVFGSSLPVWTNVIAVVVLALTVGYGLGGVLADRYPTYRGFFSIILVAGLFTCFLPLVAGDVSLRLLAILDQTDSLLLLSAGTSFILFFPPIFLLGMMSPYGLRLTVSSHELAGGESGRVYLISTLGSLAGTYLPVLVLLPIFGTIRSFWLFGALLVLLGGFGLGKGATMEGKGA